MVLYLIIEKINIKFLKFIYFKDDNSNLGFYYIFKGKVIKKILMIFYLIKRLIYSLIQVKTLEN